MATIRIDDDLKKEADKLFAEVGLTTSAAVEIFLAKFVQTGKFPFQIEVMDYQPNDETKKSFEETEEIRKTSDLMNDEDLTSYFERMKKEAAEEIVK